VSNLGGNLSAAVCHLAETEASQILEFAVALPLLLVIVVGIYDFGQAFNLKQKLTNAARDGARFAASLPTDDLSNPTSCGAQPSPGSVCAIRDMVDAYLVNSKINDCGLTAGTVAGASPWVYSASGNGCPGTLTLTIDRSQAFPVTIPGASEPIYEVGTKVSISYPYQWSFGRVIQLLVPGTSYATVSQVSVDSLVPNMD